MNKLLAWFGFGAAHSHTHTGAGHSHGSGHAHTHGVVDAGIATSERGLWAVKWSFAILAVTAVLQLVIVGISGSVALLADTIHNVADASTAIPLGIAFLVSRRKPNSSFTYGYGRVEDLAGIFIVLIILISAIVAGYEAIDRLLHPHPITNLGWVALAGVIGFAGNELCAILRLRVGREIDSVALIADGYHARTDGLTSLAVVLGALGVWLGMPLADPIIGLVITVAILGIVWQSSRSVLVRLLDGLEHGTLRQFRHAAEHVPGLVRIADMRVRWMGHRLHADLAIEVDSALSLADANRIAAAYRDELFDHIGPLEAANIRFGTTGNQDAGVWAPHQHGPGHKH